MALFGYGGRASMLEVQNRALIKTAGERARRISELEGELQQMAQMAQRLNAEVQRLKLEHEFYHKRALALEQDVRVVTEAAAKYSLWGQSLVRDLAKIDPAGAREREFGIWSASQASTPKQ
jgi:hypothetical protein